jgi:two-component system OmpR family sensor kinase
MSLRARLALTFVTLTVVVLTVAGGFVRWEVSRYLTSDLDAQLRQLRGPALRTLVDANATVRPSTGRVVEVFDLSSAYAEVRDSTGLVLFSDFLKTPSPRAKPSLPATQSVAEGQSKRFEVASTGVGRTTDYRVLVETVPRFGGTLSLALPTSSRDATLNRLVVAELIGGLSLLAAVATLAWFIAGAQLRPLSAVEDVAERIAAGELSSRVPTEGGTEVRRLAESLNAMLGRIETAFDARAAAETTLLRFVADASHELRTPLTSIRGYAELLDRLGDADPEVRAQGLRRIRSESERLSKLVNDLLTLARLDEHPELVLGPVALAPLVADVVGDARAVASSHPISVDVPTDLVVAGDVSSLTRVISNLVNNALHHTPEGTAVEIIGRREPDAVTVAVVDHGPGLTPEQREHVFDRFWRADDSRARSGDAQSGAGLGLAIVAAVVAAHGGRVTVEETDGGGARFVVTLPNVPADAPAGDQMVPLG